MSTVTPTNMLTFPLYSPPSATYCRRHKSFPPFVDAFFLLSRTRNPLYTAMDLPTVVVDDDHVDVTLAYRLVVTALDQMLYVKGQIPM
jgi:hypothetical protein